MSVAEAGPGTGTAHPVRILHISDLHRTPGAEDVQKNIHVITRLLADIRDHWALDNSRVQMSPLPGAIDLIVVSGDVIQGVRATGACSDIAEQYRQAEELLDRLCVELLSGDRARVVLVPGNHDVCWPCSSRAFANVDWDEASAKLASHPKAEFRKKSVDGGQRYDLYRRTNPADYDGRLAHFKTFFDRFYAKQISDGRVAPYQLNPEDQFTLLTFDDLQLIVLGFSSVYGNDHLHRGAAIYSDAAANAELLLGRLVATRPELRDYVRLAVWHHSLARGPEDDDGLSEESLGWVVQTGAGIGLHGHSHAPTAQPLIPRGQLRPIQVIGAGSLCAGPRERRESVPLSFNVLTLARDHVLLHRRRRDNPDAAWMVQEVFPGLFSASLPHSDALLRTLSFAAGPMPAAQPSLTRRMPHDPSAVSASNETIHVPQVDTAAAGPAGTDADAKLGGQLDAALRLVDAGNVEAASTILEPLRKEIEDSAQTSARTSSRLYTLLGVCSTRRGDWQGSLGWLTKAVEYQPDSSKGLCNLAIAKFNVGKHEEALAHSIRALEIDPDLVTADAIRVNALGALRRYAEVDQLVSEAGPRLENPEFAGALAAVRLSQGRFDDARRILEVVRDGVADPRLDLEYVRSLVAPIIQPLHRGSRLTIATSAEEDKILRRAIGILGMALERAGATIERRDKWSLLISRAELQVVVGEFAAALSDYDAVLAEDPNHLPSASNRAFLLLATGKAADAARQLQHLISLTSDPVVRFGLAEAFLLGGHAEQAVRTLVEIPEDDLEKPHLLLRRSLLARAKVALDDGEAARELADDLVARFPEDVDALLTVAEIRQRIGDEVGALAALDRLEEDNDANDRRVRAVRAQLLMGLDQFDRALPLLQQLAGTDLRSPFSRNYAVALLKTHRLHQILELLGADANAESLPNWALDIGASVHALIGDGPRALAYREELRNREPGEPHNEMLLAFLCVCEGMDERARAILEELDHKRLIGEPELLIKVCHLVALFWPDRALDYALTARRLAFDSPDTHVNYVQMFNKLPDDHSWKRTPLEVGLDTTVELDVDGQRSTYSITGIEVVNRQAGELSPSDALAKALLGRRVGEQIEITADHSVKRTASVTSIRTLQVAAYQETLIQFESKFPEDDSIQAESVGEEGFERFNEMLRDLAREQREALDTYYEKCLPLGWLGMRLGHPRIVVWTGLRAEERGLLISRAGHPAGPEERALDLGAPLVVDLTAMLTLAELRLVEALGQSEQLIVPQWCQGELFMLLWKLKLERPPSAMARYDGKHYVFTEVAPEARQFDIDRLSALRTSINALGRTSPVPAYLEIPQEDGVKLQHFLGPSGLAAALIARDRQAYLLADDLGLRRFAQLNWGVRGGSTVRLLDALVRAGHLTLDRYVEAFAKLIQLRHVAPVPAEDVLVRIAASGRCPLLTDVPGAEVVWTHLATSAAVEWTLHGINALLRAGGDSADRIEQLLRSLPAAAVDFDFANLLRRSVDDLDLPAPLRKQIVDWIMRESKRRP